MNLLFLAAGYGTRLYPHSRSTAKPLLPVAGQPAIEWARRAFDFPSFRKRVIIANSRFANDFRPWADQHGIELLENGSTERANMRGAIHDLHHAIEASGLGDRDLVVVAGDNVFGQAQGRWIEQSRGTAAVIATHDVGSAAQVRRFASIDTDAEQRVTQLIEKPSAPTTTIAGIALYYFHRDTIPLIASYLEKGNDPDKVGHLFEWLLGQIPVHGIPIDGDWHDIGDEESWQRADEAMTVIG